ncbi:MAG: diguanylate cyclase [Desulfobulbaceae bacterium]|nr:diguanylate cyclase [Desulfobulbaceae bacterium]HIJ78303.1 diguanylate cyclase [Deltaproteobacteria bacterium]
MTLQDGVTNKKIWLPFTINISMVILLIILGIFIGLFINNKRLIEAELETRARSHFNNIVLTRRWNAHYGGVYVEKKAGVASNPYLKNPDIVTADGTVYTKKNPALMTREISELAATEGDYQFHITSLQPLNPANKADEFETKALKLFEQGEKEIFTKERRGGKNIFRYMAPLYTEQSCLECHDQQGYRVGDVRGGISLHFDIGDIESLLTHNRQILIILYLLTSILLLGIIYLQIAQLFRRLRAAQEQIRLMAITDDLTGLYNRRYFFSRFNTEIARSIRQDHSLSLIIFDLDHFKKVNDTHGHNVGDIVLKQTGAMLYQNCRRTDIVARYGGEEFIILLPDCDLECAVHTAEKLRQITEKQTFTVNRTTEITITASFGVACFSKTDISAKDSAEQLVKIADLALYRAKAKGRNRVETA